MWWSEAHAAILGEKEFEVAEVVERDLWRIAGWKFDCRLSCLIDLAT